MSLQRKWANDRGTFLLVDGQKFDISNIVHESTERIPEEVTVVIRRPLWTGLYPCLSSIEQVTRAQDEDNSVPREGRHRSSSSASSSQYLVSYSSPFHSSGSSSSSSSTQSSGSSYAEGDHQFLASSNSIPVTLEKKKPEVVKNKRTGAGAVHVDPQTVHGAVYVDSSSSSSTWSSGSSYAEGDHQSLASSNSIPATREEKAEVVKNKRTGAGAVHVYRQTVHGAVYVEERRTPFTHSKPGDVHTGEYTDIKKPSGVVDVMNGPGKHRSESDSGSSSSWKHPNVARKLTDQHKIPNKEWEDDDASSSSSQTMSASHSNQVEKPYCGEKRSTVQVDPQTVHGAVHVEERRTPLTHSKPGDVHTGGHTDIKKPPGVVDVMDEPGKHRSESDSGSSSSWKHPNVARRLTDQHKIPNNEWEDDDATSSSSQTMSASHSNQVEKPHCGEKRSTVQVDPQTVHGAVYVEERLTPSTHSKPEDVHTGGHADIKQPPGVVDVMDGPGNFRSESDSGSSSSWKHPHVARKLTDLHKFPRERHSSFSIESSFPNESKHTKRREDDDAPRSSSQRMSASHSNQVEKPHCGEKGPMVQLTDDLALPLHGAKETSRAIDAGKMVTVVCLVCRATLRCIDIAQFVLCPECSCVTPLEPRNASGGVGLGLLSTFDRHSVRIS